MVKRILFASDLDNTLLFSHRHRQPERPVRGAFGTGRSRASSPGRRVDLLPQVGPAGPPAAHHHPVHRAVPAHPVAGRGTAPGMALTANGAVLLRDGQMDRDVVRRSPRSWSGTHQGGPAGPAGPGSSDPAGRGHLRPRAWRTCTSTPPVRTSAAAERVRRGIGAGRLRPPGGGLRPEGLFLPAGDRQGDRAPPGGRSGIGPERVIVRRGQRHRRAHAPPGGPGPDPGRGRCCPGCPGSARGCAAGTAAFPTLYWRTCSAMPPLWRTLDFSTQRFSILRLSK